MKWLRRGRWGLVAGAGVVIFFGMPGDVFAALLAGIAMGYALALGDVIEERLMERAQRREELRS